MYTVERRGKSALVYSNITRLINLRSPPADPEKFRIVAVENEDGLDLWWYDESPAATRIGIVMEDIHRYYADNCPWVFRGGSTFPGGTIWLL